MRTSSLTSYLRIFSAHPTHQTYTTTKNIHRNKQTPAEYNDIIILPVSENMNEGKTHAFFTWASTEAWVPPVYFETAVPPPQFSYSNRTSVPPTFLAEHDPAHTRLDKNSAHPKFWVRPDFVVKADDDSFIMLAELEARLRVDLHQDPPPRVHTSSGDYGSAYFDFGREGGMAKRAVLSQLDASSINSAFNSQASALSTYNAMTEAFSNNDPLIYWGYLVKNRFMAGEMYALSWSLVDWAAKDPVVKGLTRGAEDKQTAKWMHMHPRAEEVQWKNERCWIYDHPRAGTVYVHLVRDASTRLADLLFCADDYRYSHGFLFPSEVARVRKDVISWFDRFRAREEQRLATTPSVAAAAVSTSIPIPSDWSGSTVSSFGSRYSEPIPDLTWKQSVEALVEGSGMSKLREGASSSQGLRPIHLLSAADLFVSVCLCRVP